MGASAMAAPGGGAGNTAAAVNAIKGIMPLLLKLLTAFPVGKEDWNEVQTAVKSLGKIAGRTPDESAVPAAIRQMALAGKGTPMRAAPPIGIQPNVNPPEEPEPV